MKLFSHVFFLEKIFLKLFFIFYFFNFCFFFVAVDSLSKEKGKILFFSKKNVYVFFIALFYDVVFVVIFCSLVASLSSLCRSLSVNNTQLHYPLVF